MSTTESENTLPFNVDPDQDTVCDVIRRWAEIQPNAPALLTEGKPACTYGGLVALMDEIRAVLNTSGLGRGDRIGVVDSGGTDMLAVLLGVMSGATAVPLNPDFSEAEFAFHLSRSGINALIIRRELSSPLRAISHQMGIPCLKLRDGDKSRYGRLIIEGLEEARPKPPERAQSEDLAIVFVTSGTTSVGKIVPMGWHENMARFRNATKRFRLSPKDCCLVMRPLYYRGAVSNCLDTLYSGGSIFLIPQFSAAAFFRNLVPYGVTWFGCGPTFLRAINEHLGDYKDVIKDTRLRFVASGTSRLDPEFGDKLELALSVPVIESYGSTETGRLTSNPLPPGIRKRGTVGTAHDIDVAIVDRVGNFVGPGVSGEIVARGDQIFGGYENDAEANAAAFVDGWFRTGDEGFFDDDGFLTLTGRVKEMINRGGEKVNPAEVDKVILGHPDVRDAACFPIIHGTLGEEVAVAVVQEADANLTDQKLTKYLLQRLAGYKVPRRFYFIDEIPKSVSDKVERYKLAEILNAGPQEVPGSETAPNRQPTLLEERLQNLWAQALRIPHVGLNDNFFLIGGDSLQAVEMFLGLEKELGKRLPRAALFEAGTVAEMARLIQDDRPSSCIVPIQNMGRGAPFFCIHDGDGDVLNFRDLAKHMGEDRPFYGIQSVGLDGKDMPFTRIEDMAAHYIKEIRRVQLTGPYFIGGYSFGGRVAYVMAQSLMETGELGILALLDTTAQSGQKKFSWKYWGARHLARLKKTPASELPAYIAMRFRNIVVEFRRRTLTHLYGQAICYFRSRGKAVPQWLYRPIEANDLIRRTTKLSSFAGDAVLFRTAAEVGKSDKDHISSWRSLIQGNLKVVPISGQHFQIVKEPHVRDLAAKLSKTIKAAEERDLWP